ncbi:MAG: BMC domain-containing protein [Christensenellales bacterium]
METFWLASSISAADTAVKAADVELIEVVCAAWAANRLSSTGEVVAGGCRAGGGRQQGDARAAQLQRGDSSPHMDIVRAPM